MSMVNVVVSPRRAVMLTDASLYDASGTITHFECKAFPIDAWTGAISFRGNTWGVNAGRILGERYASFDEFVARSAPELAREYRDALAGGRILGQTLIEIHVIGWSERDDCAKGFILRGGWPVADGPEFVWRPVSALNEDAMLFDSFNARSEWRLHRQGAEPGVDFDAETFDPIRHGLPIMEESRRKTIDPAFGFGSDLHVVGGAVWLTVVDRKGARRDVIREWPDVVGEPIRPTLLDEASLPRIVPSIAEDWSFAEFEEALRRGVLDPETFELRQPPTAAGGPSRQQRRAAKAQARKGHAHAA